MIFCTCISKPVVINGACHVCKRTPAPNDTRITIGSTDPRKVLSPA